MLTNECVVVAVVVARFVIALAFAQVVHRFAMQLDGDADADTDHDDTNTNNNDNTDSNNNDAVRNDIDERRANVKRRRELIDAADNSNDDEDAYDDSNDASNDDDDDDEAYDNAPQHRLVDDGRTHLDAAIDESDDDGDADDTRNVVLPQNALTSHEAMMRRQEDWL